MSFVSALARMLDDLSKDKQRRRRRLRKRAYPPEWIPWVGMRTRCRNKRSPNYARYGGRGIKVCERWGSFKAFLADMGPRPPGTSLDRIDNNGHYEPGNCRWATHEEQSANTRQVQLIEFRGERMSITRWSLRLGISRVALTRRLRLMPASDALDLSKPAPGRRRRFKKDKAA
jgi:hypothetical protein